MRSALNWFLSLQLVLWLKDYRTWIPLLFWAWLRYMDSVAAGDYTKILTRSENIAVLVLMALMVFLLVRGFFDHTFLPEEDWDDLWKAGDGWTKVSIGIIYLAIAVIVAGVGGRVINPFS